MTHEGSTQAVSDKPATIGNHDFVVHMYFKGAYIGKALVRGVWGARTARACALRGIATSIIPMSDRELTQWKLGQSNDKEFVP